MGEAIAVFFELLNNLFALNKLVVSGQRKWHRLLTGGTV
jgi:hypothetical protein